MALLAALVSALVLPGFTPLAPGPAGGEMLTGTFPGTLRPGYVYLPPGYDPARRYPVVYLLHGMPGSPAEFLDGTALPLFADEAITSGAVAPFIAVMPAAGPDRKYNGEWAGAWEQALVADVVPWVDRELSTIASARGRVIAGLSAGGFGAVDIGVRHPSLFGAIESWSGYFSPLRDGPFRQADPEALAAHDPTGLVRAERLLLAHSRTRFFVSTGPSHSHWFTAGDTISFAGELRGLGLPVELRTYSSAKGEWRDQLDAGLTWAFGPARS